MKKNIFSESKSAKSFYAALGISAVMIGSACYFSYNQNAKNELTESSVSASESEAAVDRKQTSIPKTVTSTTKITFSTAHTIITHTTAAKPVAVIPPVTTKAVTVPKAEKQADSATKTDSKWSSPLKDMSNVINMFSNKELVKNITTGSWQTHNGADIAAKIGDDVMSIGDGEVTAVNNDPLWGTTVIIDHKNGFVSRYCGFAKDLPVQKGANVTAGMVIGSVSDTADIESALDPHLHIEVIQNGNYINPIDILA